MNNISYIKIILLLSATLFIQIGGNNISSVGFFLFAGTWILISLNIKEIRYDVAIFAFFVFMVNVIPFVFHDDATAIILRSVRWYFAFIMIIFSNQCANMFFTNKRDVNIALYVLQIALLVICAVQYILIKIGQPSLAFVPWEWFGSIAGETDGEQRVTSLAGYWLEFGDEKGLTLGEEFSIRPAATYAEPSYVGFITMAVCVIYSSINKHDLKTNVLYIISFSTLIICGTTSGAILLMIYILYKYWDELNKNPIAIIFFVCGAVAIFLFADGARIFDILDADKEASGFVRLVKPILNMWKMFSDGYIFGVPPYVANKYFEASYGGVLIGKGLDNGLLNLVLYYGILAPVILFILIQTVTRNTFVLILLTSTINGTPFGYDKSIVYFFVEYLIIGNILYERSLFYKKFL
jgi:hypothetical protein